MLMNKQMEKDKHNNKIHFRNNNDTKYNRNEKIVIIKRQKNNPPLTLFKRPYYTKIT